jgi:DNA-formamidopyrimidine glycosylase
MPEGPEVTFMGHELNERYKGCVLEKIKIVSGRYIRHGIPKELEYFMKKKLPLKIEGFYNKGKFLYMKLEDNHYIGIVLAMTGHILFAKEKHTHYHFITNCGTFYIEDIRNFASIHYYDKNEIEKKLKTIGPDLLNERVSDKTFMTQLQKKPNQMIADVLLDQHLISGVGNYLRADSLYDSKISPFVYVKDMKPNDFKRLKKSLKKIMKKAVKSHIQHKYMKSYQFLVYGRKKTKKGEEVKRKKMDNGRSIYYVSF